MLDGVKPLRRTLAFYFGNRKYLEFQRYSRRIPAGTTGSVSPQEIMTEKNVPVIIPPGIDRCQLRSVCLAINCVIWCGMSVASLVRSFLG